LTALDACMLLLYSLFRYAAFRATSRSSYPSRRTTVSAEAWVAHLDSHSSARWRG